MSEKWNKKGLPHKGWFEVNRFNLFEDHEEPEECENCSKTTFYISVLTHPEYSGDIHVCSGCAGKMTRDYERNCVLQSQEDWCKPQNWKCNNQGNFFKRWDNIEFMVEKKSNGAWEILVRAGIEYFSDHKEYPVAKVAVEASYELYQQVLNHREENKKKYQRN